MTDEDIDRFTLDGKKGQVKVLSIHDGDTCDVVFELYGQYKERFNCRLLDYDAPELNEEPQGELARDYLVHLVTGGERNDDNFLDPSIIRTEAYIQEKLDKSKNLIYAVFGEFDSFGRALVTLKAKAQSKKSINDIMREFVEKL